MKSLNIEKGRYLVAVSGGPDSMALLDMCYTEGLYIEAAHVNYHKRDTSDRDEKTVRDYCRKRKIRFHRLSDHSGDIKGNFQKYARELRYDYFASLCRRYRLDAVLTAHQQDDLIETYLMQKEKGLGVNYYGLKEETVISGVRVIRPLLGFRKDELLLYCEDHDIGYGIDESNLSDKYTRNRIRHSRIDDMNDRQRTALLSEISEKNDLKQKQFDSIGEYLEQESFSYEDFISIKNLNVLLRHHFPNVSDKHYEEIIRQLKNDQAYRYCRDDVYLVREYGMVSIFRRPDDYSYTFSSFDDIRYRRYAHFSIRKKGDSFHSATLSEGDFPLTIRNFRQGDQILMKYGTKKINRFFIDSKIPLKKRLSYPVVVDRSGKVIMVPQLGCDVRHYSHNPNLYVIEL